MNYLIDSDIVADALQGKPPAVQLLSSFKQDGFAISLITYGEIYEGVLYSKDPKASERVFKQFLREIDILPINRAIMKHFAQLRGQLRAGGNIIADFDLLIAATALQHGLILVTRNRRHFQRIPNLQLYALPSDATPQQAPHGE